MMINLLETALKKLSELSTEKQEKIAHLILEQIEENGNLDTEISPRQPLPKSEEMGQNEGLNLANRSLLSSSQDYTLDELLSSIPNDFDYPDDVTDFVESNPLGKEIV